MIWRAGIAAAGMALILAGCATPPPAPVAEPVVAAPLMYAAVEDNGFQISAVDMKTLDPKFVRQQVATPFNLRQYAGTIVVDPANKFLYLVREDGTSMRYGIGVGREGFAWSGDAVIKAKREWPKWFPPKEMQERDPEAAKYPDGMDGGPRNPLGARALYLYQGNVDTLYRLHGTNDPRSIGRAVSSGCVRLMNQDIIDLYNRVPLDTKVVVLGADAEVPVAVDTISPAG
jgi:lipoprotein-anchoring transpeptidase ErfK/SrfK